MADTRLQSQQGQQAGKIKDIDYIKIEMKTLYMSKNLMTMEISSGLWIWPIRECRVLLSSSPMF
jgi:hypothetical protein